jgi:hypothetical protein
LTQQAYTDIEAVDKLLALTPQEYYNQLYEASFKPVKKTRKPHPCHWCGQVIPKGVSASTKSVQGNGLYLVSVYICGKCHPTKTEAQ